MNVFFIIMPNVSNRKKGHLELDDIWRASPSFQSEVLVGQFHSTLQSRYGGRMPDTWFGLFMAAVHAVCYRDLVLSFVLATVYLLAQLGKSLCRQGLI